MKILIFNSLYYPNIVGGAERSVQILAEKLSEKNITTVIVSTSDKNHIDYVNGIKVYYIKTPNIYWMNQAKEQSSWKKPLWHLVDSYNIFLYNNIVEILKKEQPTVVHTNNLAGFSVIVWRAAKKLKIPIIHTIRDYYLLCPKSTMFKNGDNCKKQCISCKFYSITRKILSNNFVDAVIGVSNFILSKHIKNGYFKNSKIKRYIYNPVNFNKPIKKNKTKNKKIVFGIIGRIDHTKGIEFVLNYFKQTKLSNIELFIYGRSTIAKYEKYLKTKYKSKKIFFKGFKRNEEIYSQIDISIIPSLWHEPFSRVLAESYSYGIPVLATNRGGIPENVINGKTGFIFEPNINDFDKKFLKIIQYFQKSRFSKRIIIDYSKKFKVNIIVNEYLSIYKKILNL